LTFIAVAMCIADNMWCVCLLEWHSLGVTDLVYNSFVFLPAAHFQLQRPCKRNKQQHVNYKQSLGAKASILYYLDTACHTTRTCSMMALHWHNHSINHAMYNAVPVLLTTFTHSPWVRSQQPLDTSSESTSSESTSSESTSTESFHRRLAQSETQTVVFWVCCPQLSYVMAAVEEMMAPTAAYCPSVFSYAKGESRWHVCTNVVKTVSCTMMCTWTALWCVDMIRCDSHAMQRCLNSVMFYHMCGRVFRRTERESLYAWLHDLELVVRRAYFHGLGMVSRVTILRYYTFAVEGK
jgi:hypothetical protein